MKFGGKILEIMKRVVTKIGHIFCIEIDGEYDEDSIFDAVDSVIQDGNHREKGLIL